MADNNPDDIYNDPDTIGDLDDDVTGAPDEDILDDDEDLSDSIYSPEKSTTALDDRGDIDELELSDVEDSYRVLDKNTDPALLDDEPSSLDGDNYHPSEEIIKDEQDGTER